MEQNIRKESLLGNDKVIVGNKFTDLVLETLGKVYVKTGNRIELLDKFVGSVLSTESTQAIIVNSQQEMESMEYPGDGKFIFNKLTNALYFSLDNRYILVVQMEDNTLTGYVKRSGDLMTGPLEINTSEAPLIIASSELVSNLNAEYLNGRSYEEFAKSRENEIIYGNWTFEGSNIAENSWQFKQNVRFFKDIVTSGSLSSPEFASGFGGYGWRLDADTNTLTVDNLVVRKVMYVYEMVINQISATNGSLWVSNSVKCDAAHGINILFKEDLDSKSKDQLIQYIKNDSYYIVTTKKLTSLNINRDTNDYTGKDIGIVTESKSLSTATQQNTTSKSFVNYKYVIYIKDYTKLAQSENFTPQLLYNEDDLNNISDSTISSNLTLYYIYKQNKVTKWDESGVKPAETVALSTFDKDFQFFTVIDNTVIGIKPYYKYYALSQSLMQTVLDSKASSGDLNTVVPNLTVIDTEDGKTPTLKAGDYIRCQKYQDGNIKYYDAIVTAQIKSNSYIVQKAGSILDVYTELQYDDEGNVISRTDKENTIAYEKTSTYFNPNSGEMVDNTDENYSKLTDVAADDDLIQIGNISDPNRQNAIYITSTDDQSPFIDVISGLNRPDYSVIYYYPIFKQIKVGIKKKGDIFVKGEFDNYYYQTSKTNIINLPSILGTSKKNPIVYVELVDDYYKVYVNDGETNEIPSNTSNGFFITCYPTSSSQFESDNSVVKSTPSRITKVRIGKLDGIYNEVFKNSQPYGYGLYGENVYLTGEFYLNNGQSVVEFTKEQIKLQVENEITESIDGLQFGTRNYIKNSAFQKDTQYWMSEGNIAISIDSSTKHSNVNTLKVIQSAASDSGLTNIRVYQTATQLKPASLSFWAKADKSVSLKIRIGGNTAHMKTVSLTTNWQKFTYENVTPTSSAVLFGATAACTWWLSEPMLVEGSKATDWSPDPSEVVAQITKNTSSIEQLPDQISLTVTKEIAGGGLNYLTGTSVPIEVTGKNTANQVVTNNWGIHKSLSGKKYGAAFKIKFEGCSFTSQSRVVMQTGESWDWYSMTDSTTVSQNKEYVIFRNNNTAPVKSSNGVVQIRLDYISGGKITISELRAYDVPSNLGNEPLPWYLSKWDQELMQTQILQTAKDITLKADQTSVDSLSGRMTTAEGKITVNSQNIQSKVSQTEYNANKDVVNQKFTLIDQTVNKISLKVGNLTGGINLLPYGQFSSQNELKKWSKNLEDTVVGVGYYEPLKSNFLAVQAQEQSGGIWLINYMPDSYKVVGTTFTVSFDFFSPSAVKQIRIGLEHVETGTNVINVPSNSTYEVVRLSKTMTLTKAIDTFIIYSQDTYLSQFLIKNIKLELGDKATPYTKNDTTNLLNTGIDILNNKMIFTADNTRIQGNTGEPIAMFTVKDGRPLLAAENIDVDNLRVKQLDGASGVIGNLTIDPDKPNTGIYYEDTYDQEIFSLIPGIVYGIPYDVFFREQIKQANLLLYAKMRRNNIYDRVMYIEGAAQVYGRFGVGKAPNTGFQSNLPALITEGLSCFGQFSISPIIINSTIKLDHTHSLAFVNMSSESQIITLPTSGLHEGWIYFIRKIGGQNFIVKGNILNESNATVTQISISNNSLCTFIYNSNSENWIFNSF